MPKNEEKVETASYLIPKSYFDKIEKEIDFSVPFIQAKLEKDRSVRVRLTSTDKKISDRDRTLFAEAFQLLEDSKQLYDSYQKESLCLLLARSLKSSQNQDLGRKWWFLFIASSATIIALIGGWPLVLSMGLTLGFVYATKVAIMGIFISIKALKELREDKKTQEQLDRNENEKESFNVKWIYTGILIAVGIIGLVGCPIALAFTLTTAAFITFRKFIRNMGWAKDQLDRNALVSKIKEITSEDKKISIPYLDMEESNVRAAPRHTNTPTPTNFFTEVNSKTGQDKASYTTTLPSKQLAVSLSDVHTFS